MLCRSVRLKPAHHRVLHIEHWTLLGQQYLHGECVCLPGLPMRVHAAIGTEDEDRAHVRNGSRLNLLRTSKTWTMSIYPTEQNYCSSHSNPVSLNKEYIFKEYGRYAYAMFDSDYLTCK